MNWESTRSIIQLSSTTLGITLPVHWLKFKGLKKGDKLKSIATDKALILLKKNDKTTLELLRAFGIEYAEEIEDETNLDDTDD